MKVVQPNYVSISNLPAGAVPLVRQNLEDFLSLQVVDMEGVSVSEAQSERFTDCVNLKATLKGLDAIIVQPFVSLVLWFQQQLKMLEQAFLDGGSPPDKIAIVLDGMQLQFQGRELASGAKHWDVKMVYDRTMSAYQFERLEAPQEGRSYIVTRVLVYGLAAASRSAVAKILKDYTSVSLTTLPIQEGLIQSHTSGRNFRSDNPETLAKYIMADIAEAIPAAKAAEPRRVVVYGYDEAYQATQQGDHLVFEAVEGDLYLLNWLRVYAPEGVFDSVFDGVAQFVQNYLVNKLGVVAATVTASDAPTLYKPDIATRAAKIAVEGDVTFEQAQLLTNLACEHLLSLCPIDETEADGEQRVLRGVAISGYDARASQESWEHDPNCYSYRWSR